MRTSSVNGSASLIGAFLLTVAGLSVAAEPVGPKLTPKLRDLLRQEMSMILVASQEIQGAIVIGDHATVAGRAQQIVDSFILEQSLTEQDRKDLMAAVPPEFLQADEGFHEISAELADAARMQDLALELSKFGALTSACVRCHQEFAADRFPGLAQQHR